MLTTEQIHALQARHAVGEKLTALAKEVGMSWQKLHGVLSLAPNVTTQAPKQFQITTKTFRPPYRAQQDADGVYRYAFDGVADAVEFALNGKAQTPGNQTYLDERIDAALSGLDKWSNYYTRDRLTADLDSPPQHLLDAIEQLRSELVDEVAPPVTRPRRRVRRGCEFGDDMDVDRWQARIPECWDRVERTREAGGTVMLGVNLSISWERKPEDLLYRGAAVLALADLLTDRGYSVGIVAFMAREKVTRTVKGTSVDRIPIKDPSMPLDLGAVAFSLCEIAFVRVVGFAGGTRLYPGQLEKNLGYSHPLPAADRQGFDYLAEQNILSRGAAVRWLQGCLAQKGGQV